MNYINVIKISIFVFPFLCVLLSLPFLLYHYRKYGTISFFRCLLVFSFFFYLLCVYFLVVLPLPSRSSVEHYTSAYYNLKPFFIVPEIFLSGDFNFSNPDTYIFIFNRKYFEPIFNILMVIPFGIYLRYYFKCGFIKTLFFSFFLSLFFELTQLTGLYFIYPRPYRLFDINDLINNTFGGFIGYIITPIFSFFLPSREKIDSSDYVKGRFVSVVRSGVSVIIDYLIIILFCFILNFIGFKYIEFLYLVFGFISFVCIPFVSSGYTFGKWFLKIRNIGTSIDGSISFFRYLFKWILLHLLIFNGWFLISIYSNNVGNVPVYFYFIYLGIILFFFVYCFNCLIVRKDIFINKMLGITSISIIGIDDDEI